jgi:uncharacterized protein (DUF58 family)
VPTLAGWCTLAAGLGLYAAASFLGYPELAVLATACLVAVAFGVVWTLAAPRVRVSREIAPARVPRGAPAIGAITVVNLGRRSARLTAAERYGDRRLDIELPPVPSRGRRMASYRLPTEQRGEIAVGPLRLVHADPLGLANRGQEVAGCATLLVRPRAIHLPVAPAGRAGSVDGDASGQGRGSPVSFHALREYVPGDELRLVHWRASARTGTLVTRELRDADRPHATILLDVRPASYGPPAGDETWAGSVSFEHAVDAAASIAVAVARRGQPLRALLGGGPPLELVGAGRAGADQVLDRLATVAPDAGQTLDAALGVLRTSRAAGLLVVVTGRLAPAEADEVRSLRGRFARVLVVTTGGGAAASEPGGIGWIDGSSPLALATGWRRAAA